jgi:preflagellin peptidase FlaK
MITPIFYASILISTIGLLIATYTDLKERIVPNKLNYGLAIIGVLIYLIQSYLEQSPIPLLYSLIGLCYGFFFAWILWKMGVFAGGDVKLFMGLGALNPFTPALIKAGLFSTANIPFFPITLFIYSLIAFLPYGLFVVIYKVARNKEFQRQLYKEMKPQVLYALHAAVFASGTYIILLKIIYPTLIAITGLVILIIWGLFRTNKKYLTIITIILAVIINTNLFIQALIAAILFSVILYTAIKLLFSTRRVLSSPILVKNLEEGMIPAKSLIRKGKKIIEEEPLNYKLIIKNIKEQNINALKIMFEPKNEIISSRKARGLTIEELEQVKKLAARGIIPKKIMVKESMPFVPTMLIGYILCIILGDFALIFIMGAI